jgi:hypothetical protein
MLALATSLLAACGTSHQPAPDVECDIILQTGCADGEACFPDLGARFPDGGGWDPHAACVEAGEVETGGDCVHLTACAPGHTCYPRMSIRDGICLAFCDLDADPECAGSDVIGFEFVQRTGVRFPPCGDGEECPRGMECRETSRGMLCL